MWLAMATLPRPAATIPLPLSLILSARHHPQCGGDVRANGWYVSNVSVSWSVVDDESSIISQTGCGATSVDTDTSGTTFTCTATSAGGSDTKSVTIKRDATAPTITYADRTAANAAGWNNSAVMVNWTCSDVTSGVVNANVSQTVSSEGTNQARRAAAPTTLAIAPAIPRAASTSTRPHRPSLPRQLLLQDSGLV